MQDLLLRALNPVHFSRALLIVVRVQLYIMVFFMK